MTDKFTFRAKLEQAGAGQPVLMSGPWRDVTGGVAASAKYQLEALPEVAFDLSEASLPPGGSYPGRMSLGGGPNMVKKQQLVDRMALRFRREGEAVVGEGEGSNRVGRYSLEAECEKTGSTWEVEVRRTYRPVAVPLARQDSEVSKKRSAESSPVYDEGPRKPRAAAPPKGAWGAAKREEKSAQDDSWDKKKKVKTEDQLPCVAVVFPSEHRQASAKRRPNLAAAREHLADLQLERDAAIRVPSDQGDGVLFPPADPPPKLRDQRPPLPFSAGHVILLDVDPASAKHRSWKPTVCAFATASRAAHYCLHVARTCGPRLNSLSWLAFPDTAAQDANLRMHLKSDGSFDPDLPIADLAALEKYATA